MQQLRFDLPRLTGHLQFAFGVNKATVHPVERSGGVAATDMCPCGKGQTMSHIVNSCPQTKLEGGLQRLHSADDFATESLKTYGL